VRTSQSTPARRYLNSIPAPRIEAKGGDLDWLHFQTGSARLLPRLIAGRTRGPLFLTDRTPVPARTPATVDRCPDTGRARRR
jgi:integrase/recombinase XerD